MADQCRSKLHDDESRLIQEVLMMTKMMTKSPKNDFKIKFKIKINFKFHQEDSRFKNNQDQDSRLKDSRIKRRLNQDKY